MTVASIRARAQRVHQFDHGGCSDEQCIDDECHKTRMARDVLLLCDIAEAAERFEQAFQRSLGSASAGDILLRDQAQDDLRAALARLGAGE